MNGKTTRTLNPLHFEDLEPHRFEDMVRQLAHGFRRWAKLEATGRLGSDEGIDIRGLERTGIDIEDGDEEGEIAREESEDRLWIIQCKREKEIGPTKVKTIVKDAIPDGGDAPYGFILAAACDFSKKTRDAFHAELQTREVRESHMWGKAELEDMLFLPQYDHLLFAYFNISLQIRRRSLRTELRSRLAMKRKLIAVLGDVQGEHNQTVLLRDPREERYPREQDIPEFATFPRWKSYTFTVHQPPDHLAFIVKRHYAYVDDDGIHWDAILSFDDAEAMPRDPLHQEIDSARQEERHRIWSYWSKIPEKNQAWLKVLRFIHYDRILAVDEFGDAYQEGPHLLVEFDRENGPFGPEDWPLVEFGPTYWRRTLRPTDENRVSFFPSEIPAVTPIASPGDT